MSDRNRNPCEMCCSSPCLDAECDRWRPWFLAKWNRTSRAIRRQLWRRMDDLGRKGHPRFFRYALPHETTDPCKNCFCAAWCDTPCSLRLQWWDISMAKLRRQFETRKNAIKGDLNDQENLY